MLTTAKARLPHGGWAEWLDRLGLKARTASTWMRLATMGLTAEEVIDRGGINAALKGCKSATVADLSPSRSDLRELEDTERQIQETKAAFIVYDLGQIQDEAEFRYGLEHVPNVQVIVVKH